MKCFLFFFVSIFLIQIHCLSEVDEDELSDEEDEIFQRIAEQLKNVLNAPIEEEDLDLLQEYLDGGEIVRSVDEDGTEIITYTVILEEDILIDDYDDEEVVVEIVEDEDYSSRRKMERPEKKVRKPSTKSELKGKNPSGPTIKTPSHVPGNVNLKKPEKIISSSTKKMKDLEFLMLKGQSKRFIMSNLHGNLEMNEDDPSSIFEEIEDSEGIEDNDPSFNFVDEVRIEDSKKNDEFEEIDLIDDEKDIEFNYLKDDPSFGTGDVMGKVKDLMASRAKKLKKTQRIRKVYSKIKEGKMDFEKGVAFLERFSSQSKHAEYYLGKLYLQSKWFNLTAAKRHFFRAAHKGHEKAQFKLGHYFGYNLIDEDDVKYWKNLTNSTYEYQGQESNLALSLLFLFYGAIGGSPKANVAMGYRHYYGIGVPSECQASANYFQIGTRHWNINEVFPASYGERYLLSNEQSFGMKEKEDDIMDYLAYTAERGDPQAQVAVGYANMMGMRGLPQNGEIARENFERAIDAGYHQAYAPLAIMYANGMGIQQDNDTALELFEIGAQYNDPKAHNGLGFMYLNGAGVEKDLKKSFKHFNHSASLGNAEGQYNLASLYLNGWGVKKNDKQAFHWTKLASVNGQTFALRRLGEFYNEGIGVSKSCANAIHYFKKFTDSVYWQRKGDLAFAAFSEEDYKMAALKFMELAEVGEVTSQLNLAWMFENRFASYVFETQEDNQRNALRMYKRAAQQGNWDSHVKVGDSYYYGLLNEPNYNQSVYHYRLAADQNNAQACFNLGYMHEFGLGLPKDYFLAKRYYELASAYDNYAYLAVRLATGKLIAKWGIELGKEWFFDIIGIESSSDHVKNDDEEYGESFMDDIIGWMWNSDMMLVVLGGLFALIYFVRNFMFRNENANPNVANQEQ